MERYDAATRAFMEKVSGQEEPPANSLEPLRVAKAVIRAVQNPGRAIQRAAVKELVREDFEKRGHLSPLKIFSLLNEHHGNLWWDWEPETLWTVLAHHGVHADDGIKNIVMALQATLKTNAPFEHWHVFEKVGHAFNLGQVDFQVMQPLELEECALTLQLLHQLRPKQAFEPEIWGYIAARAADEGIVYLPPDLFGDAQKSLANLRKDHSGVGREVAGLWPRDPSPETTPAAKHQVEVLRGIKAYAKDFLRG